MIVVSNTSPLTNLSAIGRFDLLQELYGEVHIAEAVRDELNFGGQRWPGAAEVDSVSWTVLHKVDDQILVEALRADLDRGEAASIALALELKADVILLDEREGRRAAQRLGLKCVGILGILIEAKAKGLVQEIRPQLDALRARAGFFLSDALYEDVLRLVSE